MGRPLKRQNFGPLGTTSNTTGYPDSGDGRDQHGNNTTSATNNRDKGYNIPVYKARIPGAAMDVMDAGGDGADGTNLYIVAQKGARRFKVYSSANGVGVCKLVDDDGSSGIANGEMVLRGFTSTSGEPVIIQKVSGRKMYDFDGNAYTWYVDNDSTANILVLTALS